MNYKIKIATFQVVREASPRAQLDRPRAVAELARQLIPDDGKEHFGVFLLDAQNRLVDYHEVSVGTLTASLVHPREVFGPALRILGVAAVILVHNHPSGDAKPSPEDIRLTRQLTQASKILDIRLHDHVIIGQGTEEYTSLHEKGLLG